MKVLKQGNWTKAKDWKEEIICSRCASILEANIKDLIYHPSWGVPPNYIEEYASCICLVCEEELKLKVPLHVLDYLYRKHAEIVRQ